MFSGGIERDQWHEMGYSGVIIGSFENAVYFDFSSVYVLVLQVLDPCKLPSNVIS